MISLIIPVFNAEQTIINTLDSVLKAGAIQEIICVDDGSTDQSVAIMRAWAEAHPSVRLKILQQPNRGAAAARNTGIQHAAGTHLLFLDSDDTLPAECGDVYLKYMERFPECDIYLGKMVHQIHGRNQEIKTQHIPTGRTTLEETPELLQSIGPGAKLYKKDGIQHYFDTDIRFCEEHTFNVPLMTGDVYVFDDIVYEYHLDGDHSITKDVSRFDKYMDDALKVRKDVYQMLPESCKTYYSYRMDGLIVSFFIKRVLQSNPNVSLQPVFLYLEEMLNTKYDEPSFYQIIDFVLLYSDKDNILVMMNWCERHAIKQQSLKYVPGTIRGRLNRSKASVRTVIRKIIAK